MENIVIDEEFWKLIPALQAEEYALLEKSILAEGVREPLILWNGILVDGHNRHEIAQKHGVPFRTTSKDFAGRDDVKIWIINNQLGRRNISAYDRSRLALQLEPLIAAKAKERQGARTDLGNIVQNSARSRDELAKVANVSHDTIAKVKVIEQKAPEEMKQKLSSGEMSINQAYIEIKREEKHDILEKKHQELLSKEYASPTGKYDVIVIDPPWPMEKIDREITPTQTGFDYPTMEEDEIGDMVMPHEQDCHLFMWTTHKFLPMALRIVERWGFKYTLTMVWHKNGGFQPFGLPQYNCEFCVYARHGNPTSSKLIGYIRQVPGNMVLWKSSPASYFSPRRTGGLALMSAKFYLEECCSTILG